MEYIKLSDMQEGQYANIVKIDSKGDIKRRFMDLGFITGSRVLCVLSSSYNSIKAYAIRGNIIAVRNKDAENIFVKGDTE